MSVFFYLNVLDKVKSIVSMGLGAWLQLTCELGNNQANTEKTVQPQNTPKPLYNTFISGVQYPGSRAWAQNQEVLGLIPTQCTVLCPWHINSAQYWLILIYSKAEV